MAVVRVRRLAVPAAGHEAAHALAAADAKPAAFAALDQHDADQRQGDENMDNEQDGKHKRAFMQGQRDRPRAFYRSPARMQSGAALRFDS